MPRHEAGTIDKLDFPSPSTPTRAAGGSGSGSGERTHLIRGSQSVESLRDEPPSHHSLRSGHFFEDVAEGIQERDRERLKREVKRYVSFVWALVCCGSAGSITAFSLYGPLFLTRLHYTQYRVNLVSIIAEIALYLPIAIVGFLNDRYGPRRSAFQAAVFFGVGYFVAAFTYRSGPPKDAGGDGWPFGAMVFAFICVGIGTSSLHLAGLTTCAKNFGRGKHKGFALSAPIAMFGLSGFWQSQVGSGLLYEKKADGSRGDVDVFRFFIFLGSLLIGVGLVGSVLLRLVDEEEILEEAVEELERSGLLDEADLSLSRSGTANYGTVSSHNHNSDPAEDREERKRREDEEARIKAKVLNTETKRFLTDRTMWWLAGGFFLVTGPGEAFINNLGTVIGTLYPPPTNDPQYSPTPLPLTPPATHVSIVAITSTIARLVAGTVSDLLAPPIPRHQRNAASLTSSLASLDPLAISTHSVSKFGRITVSRMPFLLFSSVVLAIGFGLLASGAVQNHAASLFWVVSAFAGVGYGSVFTLVPIMISCVWGIENFGTNFGIVAVVPAFGAAVWGVLYAFEYESGRRHGGWESGCYGTHCYRFTFWGMTAAVLVACVLWTVAWRGPGGWKRKGIAV